ncbi:gp60 [Rhodococcus phage ReqiPine5]|uniref:Gp60 n=1 Tax=Rhodococcus phage ReqiPine5 TaxID=691963 RepID=D4P835_9CAUD|nr:gp60 [Rhodococcus phage ReqiPine5]ADD81165.1 gp60 [Rhodococcus phage ReqiPine5]
MSTWDVLFAVALSAPGMFMAGWSVGRNQMRSRR